MTVYVDDIVVTGNDLERITALKAHLHKQFRIKDMGLLHYFLGLEITYVSDGIMISQKRFVKELLASVGQHEDFTKKAVTPLPLACKLPSTEGKLNFLTNTRPDLSFTTQYLSQFVQTPRIPDWNALLHTLRYVFHTANQGILLQSSNQLVLQAFSDSDWAACPD
ncbi:uncharacterized mitochondrial protein AtMg00810-like [Amaranthus tricolor]|uniref:uncharacterized mitochondrial protein AtMg00810-like n=1 Tax=Amaranthus tricolor TaxID=29722 RepID=UPI002585CEAD|nr:uncharacterized mitochondrial protein AtMg00810-like [Amaranthus tricolor]